MKLQIECNHAPFQKQLCLTCDSLFEMSEARVIVCNDQGKFYGEVCPHCLKKGFDWLGNRFEQVNKVKEIDVVRQAQTRRMPVGA